MSKIRKIVIIFVMMFSIFFIASCDGGDTGYKLEDLEALEFNDKTVAYDGESHSIIIENVPEGIEVTYTNNERTVPGTYEVNARIVYEDLVVKKKATLTITKQTSVLTAEDNQVLYLYGGNIKPQYSITGKNHAVTIKYFKDGVEISKEDIYKVGSYTAELYAKSNTYYEESNHVTINFEVKNSNFGLSFEDVNATYDGTEKEIKLNGDLPEGYTVKYTDNKGTEVGCYYAKAEVCDASGNVVETHAATLEIDYAKNEAFEEYLDDFFVLYLEEDQLSVNIFCVNPEDFGLGHYEAQWYTFTPYEEGFEAEAIAEFEAYYEELLTFKDAELSSLQKVAYNNIEGFLTYYLEYYSIPDSNLMKIVYVDQFGGYVADFGTYMEAYSLRSELEVQDVIDYVESTLTAFPSYLDFVQAKEDAGYALSDFTITEMRNYLSDVLEDGEDYYLEDVIIAHINAVDFLSDSKKADYASQVTAAFKNCFIPGVQALYDGLEAYMGKLAAEDEGYWSVYEHGKELYELELEDLLGLDLDMDAYIKELDTALKNGVSKVISAQSALSRAGVSNASDYPIMLGEPDDMLVYLKEFAKTIVPELETTPDISVKEMDKASAAVSNAVAYYMKSALDNFSSEHITLNPLKLGDSNDVLGTLSHEGYPGHLYAYVYSKQLDLHNLSKIMTSTAHGEGWATYVELKLYQYAKEQSDDSKLDAVMDYLYANQILGFLLETRLDAGIHYQGWKPADVAKFMRNTGYNADEESAKEIYNLLIEMPSGYAAYGYGKLTFVRLHDEAQKILGGFYDEVEFNAMLLSKGWTGLGELQETYNAYMTKKCHEYGLKFGA